MHFSLSNFIVNPPPLISALKIPEKSHRWLYLINWLDSFLDREVVGGEVISGSIVERPEKARCEYSSKIDN